MLLMTGSSILSQPSGSLQYGQYRSYRSPGSRDELLDNDPDDLLAGVTAAMRLLLGHHADTAAEDTAYGLTDEPMAANWPMTLPKRRKPLRLSRRMRPPESPTGYLTIAANGTATVARWVAEDRYRRKSGNARRLAHG